MFFELLFHFRHRTIEGRHNIGSSIGCEKIIRVLRRSNDLDLRAVSVDQVGDNLNPCQSVEKAWKLGNLVLDRVLS